MDKKLDTNSEEYAKSFKKFAEVMDYVLDDKLVRRPKIRDCYPNFWFTATLWLIALFGIGFWVGWLVHRWVTTLQLDRLQ